MSVNLGSFNLIFTDFALIDKTKQKSGIWDDCYQFPLSHLFLFVELINTYVAVNRVSDSLRKE